MAIRLSVVVLRWLLGLYPSRFRRRHGAFLLQNSVDLLRAAHRRRGARGVALLWPRLLHDLVRAGLAERASPRHRIPTTTRRLPMFDRLFLDLAFARRAITRRPGANLLAVAVLALGIGASVSMFSVLDAVVLRPLPYPGADRLMSVYTTIPDWRGNPSLDPIWSRAKWEYDEFREWRARQSSFDAASLVEDVPATLTGRGPAERIDVGLAGLELFPLLGATPHRGRFFVPQDEQEGGVVVVSHAFWRDHLQGDDDVVGQTITVDGASHGVVGVLPPGFEVSGFAGDVWMPIFGNRPGGYFPGPNTGDNRHVFHVVGTLRAGVTTRMAADEAGRLLRAIGGEDHFTEHGATVVPRRLDETRAVRAPMMLLMGAVLLLLLVACANVATVLLGQAIDRRHEIAVRAAVGADRGRIIRQLLTESAVLGALAGAAGLGLARVGIPTLMILARGDLPRLDAVSLDLRAAGFAVSLSLLASLLFGLAPAFSVGRGGMARPPGTARSGDAGRGRLQAAMVVAEMTVATVLLVGAGLLTRSFLALDAVDPGFRPEGVVVVELALDYESYSSDDGQFRDGALRARVDEIVDAVEALPGVEQVALNDVIPFHRAFSPGNTIEPEGVQPPAGELFVGHRRFVTPGYLELMGIPLVEGRYLEPRDNRPDAASVVVVTETLARRFWPGESAIGKRLGWWEQESLIVGVVGSVRHEGLDAPPQMQFYAPQARFGEAGGAIFARTRGDGSAAMESIRDVVRREAPELPITLLTTMTGLVAGSLDAVRFRTRLIAVFAVIAALLSALGLYGVKSRAVAGRAREIGIRVALGAEARRVVVEVLRDGVRLALVGALVGLAMALAGTRLLQGFLYGVEPGDPLTLALIVGLVIGIGTLATLVPALRAARVDPVEVLRSE